MTVVGTKYMSIQDIVNLLDPDGMVADVAEVLAEDNDIINDMMWTEGNQLVGMQHTIRTGYPSGTWREYYGGVQPTKSTKKKVLDTCALLEATSEIDEDELSDSGAPVAIRADEDDAFVEGLRQDFASAVFYASTNSDPNKFHGLAPRYNTLATVEQYGYHDDFRDNVINGGGTGSDNTSIWLIDNSKKGMFGFFPKGTKAGLQIIDGSRQYLDAPDSAGKYWAMVTSFKWKCGVAVKNWKHIVRIPNIDISSLSKTGDTLAPLMITSIYRVPEAAKNLSFYCNRTIQEYLHHQARNKSNVNLTIETFEGKKLPAILGIPVKRCDAILNSESAVTT